jgi:lipoprotein NlpD
LVFALLGGCPYQKSGRPSSPESPSLTPKAPAPGVYHTVASNESLWKIAKAYSVNLQLLAEVNNLKPPYLLRENTQLFIPDATNVKRIETISQDIPDGSQVEEYTGLLSWPVQGEIMSHYGVRSGEQHNGISIQARAGTPVRSAGDGKVGHVGTIPGFGNVVLIEHANRIVTVYAHLKDTRAKTGMPVKKGQVIGTVGSTGRVESPSLYFEVRSRSKPRNPLFFLSRGKLGTR